MEHHTVENWEPRGVEEVGCKIYGGAPTVSQTAGEVSWGEIIVVIVAVVISATASSALVVVCIEMQVYLRNGSA